jgi:lysozyme family protein
VFDFGVNAGPKTSVKLLQRSLGAMDDGAIGPVTLKLANSANPVTLISTLEMIRINYYRGLADFAVFGNGWTNRSHQVAALAQEMAKKAKGK